MQELSPIFDRLSNEDLLKRCLLGLTQNQNESLNGTLWTLIPKTLFLGKRQVTIGSWKNWGCLLEEICLGH